MPLNFPFTLTHYLLINGQLQRLIPIKFFKTPSCTENRYHFSSVQLNLESCNKSKCNVISKMSRNIPLHPRHQQAETCMQVACVSARSTHPAIQQQQQSARIQLERQSLSKDSNWRRKATKFSAYRNLVVIFNIELQLEHISSENIPT